ncbi:hypothetical protein D7D52_31775 [Nocardia yunnanensis]|uniref:Uncharacterized protein n=1 Tax=Nocardia yunnanensis TaxID=2382165 RepID=A0A386ZM38_9NOCA|nr:hypothetical protein [Nocardia yunnanensis]AYF77635.1 hypothetical protein D7D52_31775 [Nocardia yunnanensis]
MNNQIQFADRNFGYFTVQQPRRINYKIATALIATLLTLGYAAHLLPETQTLSAPASATVLH